jgi:two-component system nitrogen regulation response regulator NtrX
MANLVELLVIEESNESLAILDSLAEEHAWRVGHVKQLHEANDVLRQKLVSVVLLDLNLAKGAGEAALSTLKQGWPALEVVVLAPQGDALRGLRALKLGAYDSVARPLDRDVLAATLQRAVEKSLQSAELRALRAREDEPAKLLGESAATKALREALAKAGSHDGNVLLLGDAGTGKQMAARVVHSLSSRRKGPFVCVNCADYAPDKLEAELFGSEQPGQGVKIGRFEQASGGSVLLHHVDFLSAELQVKLLRALQDRGFMRVGGLRFVGLDARVLATAGIQTKTLIKSSQFREDLYWRLGATPLEIPPLRERSEDIEDLFTVFLHRRCRLMRRGTPVVRPEALDALKRHNFPGNVRELQDLVGLVAALAAEEVGLADLPIPIFIRSETNGRDLPLKKIVHSFERQVIMRTLRSVKGNQSRAAETLDIHRNTLILKMQELEIPNKKTIKKGKKA